jgi:hypothetical protein
VHGPGPRRRADRDDGVDGGVGGRPPLSPPLPPRSRQPEHWECATWLGQAAILGQALTITDIAVTSIYQKIDHT